MRAPSTYAEWVAVLDLFGNRINDEETIDAMRQGTITWQSGVAERFLEKLLDAANKRLNTAIDRFDAIKKRPGTDDRQLANALINLRKEYITVLNALDIPALPDGYRRKYLLIVKQKADTIQSSLISSSKTADRSGKMLSLIKKHPVNKF